MPKPVENNSSDLIDFLKDRFTIADSIDENGNFTDDPAKTKVFSFNYVDGSGKDRGSIVISLLDDNESTNSLKVYFGQELGNPKSDIRDEWYAFLQDIRQFAKMHLLGFDVRNLNKSKITRRDIEHDLRLTESDLEPMFESTFGPIDGSVKTSKQPLGNLDIVIKHTDRVNSTQKGGRSRRIQRIYLANNKGERFLLPFKSLVAARAMARHIEAGGTPYDSTGKHICALVDEMLSLGKFYRTHKNTSFTNRKAASAVASARERYLEIKKTLSSLTSKGGYGKNSSALNGTSPELEEDDLYEDIFDGVELDEDSQLALPHVMRAYRSSAKTNEEDEFEKWVNATHGNGEGDEMLADDADTVFTDQDAHPNSDGTLEFANSDPTEHAADFRSPQDLEQTFEGKFGSDIGDTCSFCHGDDPYCIICNGTGLTWNEKDSEKPRCPACGTQWSVTTDDNGDYKCSECQYKWKEGQTEHGYDIYQEHPDDFYFNESQEEEGHEAAEEDLEEIDAEHEFMRKPTQIMHGTDASGANVSESIDDNSESYETPYNELEPCHVYGHKFVADDEYSATRVSESTLNEFFGMFNKSKKTAHDVRILEMLMEKLGFENVSKAPDNQIWIKSYFTVIFGPAANGKLGWVLSRNGQFVGRGFGSQSFFEDLFMNNPEFSGELHRINSENNSKNMSVEETITTKRLFGELAKQTKLNKGTPTPMAKCPHCQKSLYLHNSQNGKVYDFHMDNGHICNGSDQPVISETKGIIDNLIDEFIFEADIPVSAGFAGPLTFPQVELGSKFHTKKQIHNHENTTGKLSPFSLISSPEKNVDEDDKEISRISALGVRNLPMPFDPNGMGGIGISRW